MFPYFTKKSYANLSPREPPKNEVFFSCFSAVSLRKGVKIPIFPKIRGFFPGTFFCQNCPISEIPEIPGNSGKISREFRENSINFIKHALRSRVPEKSPRTFSAEFCPEISPNFPEFPEIDKFGTLFSPRNFRGFFRFSRTQRCADRKKKDEFPEKVHFFCIFGEFFPPCQKRGFFWGLFS